MAGAANVAQSTLRGAGGPLEIANVVPDRMVITNIETADAISAQFNPEQIKEELGASYNDLQIMGLSHKSKQFQNTENLSLTFDLNFDELSNRPIETPLSETFTVGPAYARRFMHALFYPSRRGVDVVGGGTPRVLFTWGETWGLTTKIVKLSATYKRFSNGQGANGRKLAPTLFTMSITIEEARVTRLFYEDVIVLGTVRPP